VPPEDPQQLAAALARLLTDPALKTSLAINARARAAEFDWYALAQRFNHVIDGAIQGARNDDQ
jgi:glycosyltransferase involved in cell wall biosynthesis